VRLGELDDLVRAADRVGRAGHEWGVGLERDVPGLDLVAEPVDRGRAGPDPDQPGVQDGLGEAGVLGEEAIAGVDGVGPRLLGDGQQLLLDEVAVAGGRPVQGIRLVRHLDVQGVPVGIGIHRHRSDPGVLARPGDAHGNLAAVCDQHL
jgi:hypothetical protein